LEQQRKWVEMESVLQTALGIESHHATGHYLLGTALQKQKRYSEAWQARETALLLDISRKRSLPAYAEVAKSVCSTHQCATKDLYPKIKADVEENGMDVFRQLYGDHEHLNPKGIELIATQFTELITHPTSP